MARDEDVNKFKTKAINFESCKEEYGTYVIILNEDGVKYVSENIFLESFEQKGDWLH